MLGPSQCPCQQHLRNAPPQFTGFKTHSSLTAQKKEHDRQSATALTNLRVNVRDPNRATSSATSAGKSKSANPPASCPNRACSSGHLSMPAYACTDQQPVSRTTQTPNSQASKLSLLNHNFAPKQSISHQQATTSQTTPENAFSTSKAPHPRQSTAPSPTPKTDPAASRSPTQHLPAHPPDRADASPSTPPAPSRST